MTSNGMCRVRARYIRSGNVIQVIPETQSWVVVSTAIDAKGFVSMRLSGENDLQPAVFSFDPDAFVWVW
jgi:hypothetical protein